MNRTLLNPNPVNQKGFSGFDMSHFLKFTSTTGELLPVYYDILYPNDKVTLSTELKTRLMPMNSAAMGEVKEYIDWFAVPIDQLYTPFSSVFYDIDSLKSSLFNRDDVGARFPFIPASVFNQAFSDMSDLPLSLSYPFPNAENLTGMNLRLVESLGIPLYPYHPNADGFSINMAINPLFACAYQKIYYDYYRITDRESNKVTCYNLDRFYSESQISDADDVVDMFTLRFRPLAKDFFTNNFVSPIFAPGSTSSLNVDVDLADSFKSWLTPKVNSLYMDPSADVVSGDNATSVAFEQQDLASMISPNQIAQSFAVQKLLEVTRRAGKRLDQQTLAHFGVKPSKHVNGEVYYIGGSDSSIEFWDVVSTAETSEAALGQIGGRGFGYNKSQTLKFENDFQCPVILMAIYSCAPSMDYRLIGLDRFNTYTTPADYFHTEFDNLGMQPLFGYQTRFEYDPSQSLRNSGVIGWQYRYSESKIKYNKIIGGLARSLDYWTIYCHNHVDSRLESYLCSPNELDSVMVTPFQFDVLNCDQVSILDPDNQGKTSDIFMFDPLIHSLYFDVKKSSKMSIYSLQEL